MRISTTLSRLTTAGCLLIGAGLLAGCANNEEPSPQQNDQQQNEPAGNTAAPAPSGQPTDQRDKDDDHDDHDDAPAKRIKVTYRGGTVTPAPGVVTVKVGQKVQVDVTSDQHDDILVKGFPDETSDVDPGDSEDVDFTPRQAGDIPVTLKSANTTLVTIRATR